MDKNLERLARIHIRALRESKGDPTAQFYYLQALLESNQLSNNDLLVTPEEIMADPDAKQLLLDAFRDTHFKQFKKRFAQGNIETL